MRFDKKIELAKSHKFWLILQLNVIAFYTAN